MPIFLVRKRGELIKPIIRSLKIKDADPTANPINRKRKFFLIYKENNSSLK